MSADEEAEQSTDLWVPMRECLNEWEQQSHSRHPCILNGQLAHKDATEKLFLHTIYSALILTDVLYFVLIYTKKGLFQWPSYRGEGILATVVKIVHIQKASDIDKIYG